MSAADGLGLVGVVLLVAFIVWAMTWPDYQDDQEDAEDFASAADREAAEVQVEQHIHEFHARRIPAHH